MPKAEDLLHSFDNVKELQPLETLSFAKGSITGLPFMGEHGDLDIQSKLGFRMEIEGTRVLALADSNNIVPELYAHVHRIYGDIDVLFLGMECDGAPISWLYGPYFPQKPSPAQDQSRRLSGSDFEAAIDLVNRFHPQEVYVYAMGQEPWIKYITSTRYTEASNPIIQSNKLLAACKDQGILAERLYGTKIIQPQKQQPA